jgi:lysophospholipase L1-like esterase
VTPTTTRIIALGDSTTAGTPGFLSPLEAPPNGRGDDTSQFAYWLRRARPHWEVLNRGINGERSDEIAARMQRDVIDAAPAAVVIIAGVNDVYQGLAADRVTATLRAMYDRAAHAGIRVVAGTIVPYNTASADENARMRQINAWIRAQVDADPAIAVADTRAAVAKAGDPDQLAESPDGLHPSPAGYQRMAEALLPVLDLVLRGILYAGQRGVGPMGGSIEVGSVTGPTEFGPLR